ncbi:peroxisomal membrane protein PMP34 isoform X1 [Eurytemora carolleeae]|uniref:peroxisomal membrane protein PMP34 isoform X1 n=1 Tax=Eurytemora carolleeae TaxID=1294199 RepID=UPI000C791D59|nr:peroxisomal membrane protein PMP34 isoform X1 [Eurytemora carolleeae]|eukprot:XP_023329234.1 peroxisomal membrane protein PMP34-like isoform X1 [Eurytemora affinis]
MDNKLFSYNSLVQAIAGASGSVCAQLLTMPLTTSFTRAQLDSSLVAKGPLETIISILEKEGLQGLYRGCEVTCKSVAVSNFVYFYRGCEVTCKSVAVSNFVYFYLFHGLKNQLSTGPQTPLKDLLIACIAGSLNVLTTNPLWVVSTRLKMAGINEDNPRYKGLLDGIRQISRKEGLGALWNGTKASLLLVSNPAIKFTVYELLKRKFFKDGSVVGVTAFLLGALSTAVSTILTYPLQILQSRARNSLKNLSLRQILVLILREDGLEGLFRGLDSKENCTNNNK